jgi:hypothetical protein
MHRYLRHVVALFGVICVLISLAHIFFGPAVIPGSVQVNATMDSEDRFYATLFTGYGIATIWCSLNLAARKHTFEALLAVFFLGGIARVISITAVGWPNLLFVFLGSLELILPPMFWYWLRTAHATQQTT